MAEHRPARRTRPPVEAEAAWNRSWLGGFAGGILLGGLGSAVALTGLSLSQPLPAHLPGVGTVTVVAPSTDQTLAAQEPTGADAASGTSTVEQADADLPVADGGEVEPAQPEIAALSNPVEDDPVPATLPQTGDPASGAEEGAAGSAAPDPQADPSDARSDAASDDAASDDAGSNEAGSDETSEVTSSPADDEGTDGSGGEGAEGAGQSGTAGAETDLEQSTTPDAEASGIELAALAPAAEDARPLPSFAANARDFDAPKGAPLMAVVLEDPGRGGVQPDALALLTMPLTVAVRPDRSGAGVLAGAARAAGHEVLAQLPLEDAGVAANRPQVLADAARNHLADMTEAIGATVPASAPLLQDQAALEAILTPLARDGFTYLDLASGVGSAARRISQSAGFAYAESNRYAGPEATEEQIYEVLDGAAFQARRRGTAIVSVAASQAALKAVVRWGLERGGQEVWFAPLSAVVARRKEG